MSALNDVSIAHDGTEPSSVGVAPGALPLSDSDKGDAVRNTPPASAAGFATDREEWYALRTPFLRADKVKEWLEAHGHATHLPKRKVVKLVKGKRRKVWEALIPNTLFAYGRRADMERLVKQTSELQPLSYVYNHCIDLGDGMNPPLTIPDRQMQNFIRLVGIDNDNIVNVTNNHITYRLNDRVRITQGEFKGIEGRVAKIFGQTRVVVELEGLCLMATAYIPKAFLSIISKEEQEKQALKP